jgi:hypothetical protein
MTKQHPSIIERFMPPVCKDTNDWITMWCFIFCGIFLLLWIAFLVFFPLYADNLFKVAIAMGSFAVGRVSIIILPTKEIGLPKKQKI